MRRIELWRAAVIAAAVFIVASCERELAALGCPCVSGYECCPLDDRCYPSGEGCPGGGGAGGDGGSSAAASGESASGSAGASTSSEDGGASGASGEPNGGWAGGIASSQGGAAGDMSQGNGGGVAGDASAGIGGGEPAAAGAPNQPGALAGAFPRYCGSSGWCGAKHAFHAAWGLRGAIWAAANDRNVYGTNSISRWDGERWTNFDQGRSPWGRILAIGGSAADDVWFVGDDTVNARVEHWDGRAFTMFDVEAGELRGVWANARDDAWAVGVRGYTLHYDGAEWSAQSSPSFTNDLNSVWGSAADDVIAVGSNGLVARWNGATWALEREGPGPDLASVWGSAPHDVWVVGTEATVLHFDGEAWTERDVPLPELEGVDFVAVTGTSARDVWLAEAGGRLVHYDGVSFRVLPTTAKAINVMAPVSSGEAWVFGDLAFSARCERTGCTESNPITHDDLLAVWGRALDDVWAVGANGRIVHFDGTEWRSVASPTTVDLRAIHGAGERIWAVGDAVVRYEDGDWSLEAGLEAPPLHAVLAFASDDVWIAGEGSTLRHFDGDAWTSFDVTGSVRTFTGLWGSAVDDVWAVGVGDTNLRYDGANWTKLDAPGGISFDQQIIAGTSRDNAFIYGWYLDDEVPSFGEAHWDGRAWSFEGGDYGTWLGTYGKAGAWAVGPRDVWVVTGSDYGSAAILRLGSSSRHEFAGTDLALHGVWGISPQEGWAVGAAGTVLEKVFSPPE